MERKIKASKGHKAESQSAKVHKVDCNQRVKNSCWDVNANPYSSISPFLFRHETHKSFKKGFHRIWIASSIEHDSIELNTSNDLAIAYRPKQGYQTQSRWTVVINRNKKSFASLLHLCLLCSMLHCSNISFQRENKENACAAEIMFSLLICSLLISFALTDMLNKTIAIHEEI